jgi:hypothetical protein
VRRNDDRLSAVVWAVFGGVVLVASLRMDRLETLGINPWSFPGLTPAVVGVLMIVLAGALALQARRSGMAAGPAEGEEGAASPEPSVPSDHGGARRTLVAALLCVGFAGVSLGRGLPFAVEAAVFIFVFTTVFSWTAWRADGRILRGLLVTLVVAAVAATFIAWLFESVFLVRLP